MKPPRFTTPDQIEQAIDRAREKHLKYSALYEVACDEWKVFVRSIGNGQVAVDEETVEMRKKDMKHLKGTANGALKRAERLGKKLSEMRTVPMTGVIPDASVPC